MFFSVPLVLLSDRRDERVRGVRVGEKGGEGEDDFVEGQGWGPGGLQKLKVVSNPLDEIPLQGETSGLSCLRQDLAGR
jgi:hypothetical protein